MEVTRNCYIEKKHPLQFDYGFTIRILYVFLYQLFYSNDYYIQTVCLMGCFDILDTWW